MHCILEEIKTSFVFNEGSLIFPLLQFNSLNVADWRDITTEKLRIVADRGQKKDFYDLFFGLSLVGMDKLVELAFEKFGRSVNYFHILKGMTYFEDAENNPEPLLLDKSVTCDEIKHIFLTSIPAFEKSLEKII